MKNQTSVKWQIAAAFSSRLLLNTSRRLIYPFAPAFSRGLEVPLSAVTSIIAVNQFTGLAGLIFGPLADRWGYRPLMLTGLGVLIAGMLLGAVFGSYPAVFIAFLLAGLAKSIFDPSILAYLGRVVPYERRGFAIGIVEMAWAGSALAGIPLVGFLMEGAGWRSPFFVLGGLGLAGFTILAVTLPRLPRPAATENVRRMRDIWKHLIRERAALGALGYAFFFNGANDALFVIYGIWLEDSFGLSISALGLAAIVIGLAELFGESMTAVFSDRAGLKESVFVGVAVSAACYLSLPLMGASLPLALAGLFLIFICVEFTIVTSMSLFTELLPDARATMMAGYLAAASLGRVCGALAGGAAWSFGGLLTVGSLAAAASLFGLLSLIRGLRGFQARPSVILSSQK